MSQTREPNLACRFYRKQYPEVDEVVVVQVKSIAEMGAYVSLLEYDGIEGMILMSELSRRRIRSVNKLIRVGRQEMVMVLRVDKEKGYIDLSKRRVIAEEVPETEDRWNKAKAVHSIMRHTAKKSGIDVETLYEEFGWDMYDTFKHGYDAFKLAIAEPDTFFGMFKVREEIHDELMQNIRRRLTPQPTKIRADIEITCFGYDGIDGIKHALVEGHKLSTEEIKVEINLVAPPLYVITTTTLDKEGGIALLTKICDRVGEVIKEHDGELQIKAPPRAVSDRDERMLTDLMQELELQNQQVDGDEDHDEE